MMGGNGQIIDLPLLDPLFSFIATEAAIYRLTGTVRQRTGSRSETTSPRNVFRTRDGRYIDRAVVTAAPVYDIDQFMAGPHVLAREILVDMPATQWGACRCTT